MGCNHDCDSCGGSCGEPESLLKAPHPLSKIKKVIGVVSGKGGVGKSMVTSLLAVAMQRQGAHCGILDADITGPSIPKGFGLTGTLGATEEGVYPMATKTGIDVCSINLLMENASDPVIWRGPVIAGAATFVAALAFARAARTHIVRMMVRRRNLCMLPVRFLKLLKVECCFCTSSF